MSGNLIKIFVEVLIVIVILRGIVYLEVLAKCASMVLVHLVVGA